MKVGGLLAVSTPGSSLTQSGTHPSGVVIRLTLLTALSDQGDYNQADWVWEVKGWGREMEDNTDGSALPQCLVLDGVILPSIMTD